MDNILDYVANHYISVVLLIVIILLAIIGYYTEKANNEKHKKLLKENLLKELQKENSIKLENELINPTVIDSKKLDGGSMLGGEQVVSEEKKDIQNDQISSLKENLENLSEEIQSINNEVEMINSGAAEVVAIKTTEPILNKEEVNNFDEEIEALLPRKEIIDSDLLSDIDDLELGKTQKLDLNQVPELDNIDLPKIKQMDKEVDIWKF